MKTREEYIQSSIEKSWHRYKEGKAYLQKIKHEEKELDKKIEAIIGDTAKKQDGRIFPFKD